jgi:uncharacterized protein YxeA
MEPDNQPMSGAPTPNPTPSTPAPTPAEGSVGPVVATIIILAIIVLGGIYFWSQRNLGIENPYGQNPTPSMQMENNAKEPTTTENTTAVIESQGSSDNLDSIEADLRTTNTADLDSGLY